MKRAASTSPTYLVGQLRPLRSDPSKLFDALARFDAAEIGDAFVELLSIAASAEENVEKRRKLARNRPRIPNETFEDVVFYMDRDTLDSMQLACRFILDFICKREKEKLALRTIEVVQFGENNPPDDEFMGGNAFWLPTTYVSRGRDNEQWFTSSRDLSAYLRMSYCEEVRILLAELQSTASSEEQMEQACDVLFDDLNLGYIPVGILSFAMVVWVILSRVSNKNVLYPSCIYEFRSVKDVRLDLEDQLDLDVFNKEFLAGLVEDGVRSFRYDTHNGVEMSTDKILAFGFADPTAGGDRRLVGIKLSANSDFLAELRKTTSALVGDEKVDFNFKIRKHSASPRIDPTGFEKHRESCGMWVFNNMQNKILVEVKETKKFVKIRAYSPP